MSLDKNATTVATRQRVETQLTPNNVERCIGDLRSLHGHQAQQADWMLPAEAMKKSSVNTIDDVTHWYDHYTGKLRGRDKYVGRRKKEFDQMEAFSVNRRVKNIEATGGTHVRMKEIAPENGDFVR